MTAVSLYPGLDGGLSTLKINATASTNAQLVKANRGQLFGVGGINNSAAALYLKFYDSATIPTAGVGTPRYVIGIPAGGRLECNRPLGVEFVNGIGLTIVTGASDADATAVAADNFVGNVDFK